MPETINIAKGIADMNIGNRIKNRRIELGMTQQELAVKIGFKTRSHISLLEQGDRNIPISKIEKLANALEVSPEYLMGWEDMTQTTNTGNHNTTTNITNNYDACSNCSVMNGKSNYEHAINAMMRLDNEEVQSIISFAESLIKARSSTAKNANNTENN